MATANNQSEREDLLNGVLLAYVEAIQQGRAPDRRQLLSRYPEIAADLKEFFALRDQIDHLAAPLREAALAGASSRGSSKGGHKVQIEDSPLVQSASPGDHPAGLSELGQIGEFRLIREIGRGGMGVVYEAHQTSLNRRVALKVLPFAAAIDPKQLQRFTSEAQAAAQLHHTNIVPVFGVGHERGVHYYAMQFIEGQSLATLIDEMRRQERLQLGDSPDAMATVSARGRFPGSRGKTTGPYPPPPAPPDAHREETATTPAAGISTDRSTRRRNYFRRVAQIGRKAAEALEHAHQLGVVHRDIKPANLLLDVRGDLWITDFGLALFQTGAGLTMTGELLGTLRYMSPEQAWAKRGEVDHRTDIYSLGVTLYELLTLRPAVDGQDRQELLQQIASEEPRPPRQLDKAIPVELETIVLKAIAKSPGERYATAQELADDLERFLEDKPILARRPTLRERATKWARRHKPVVVSAIVLMLLAMIGSVISTVIIAGEHAQTKAAYKRERQNFEQARRAVDFFVKVSEEELADDPAWQRVRRTLLQGALNYYQEFIDQHGDDPSLKEELAESYTRLANILNEFGDKPDAMLKFEKARELRLNLVEAHPTRPEFREGLASIERNLIALQGCGQVLVLTQKDVEEDLKLSKDQRDRIVQLSDQLEQQRHQAFENFRQLSPKERRQHLERMATENEKAVAAILTPEQTKRLRQIGWQVQGALAFADPDVVAALRLTDKQKEQILEIQEESLNAGARFMHHGHYETAKKEMEESRRNASAKIRDVLTADQKSQWKRLIGEPFQGEILFAPPPPPRHGGFHPPPGPPFGRPPDRGPWR